MHTYLLLMVLDRIPHITAVAGRKKAVLELKERIGSRVFNEKKTGSVSQSIIKRVAELELGKLFERIDFEKLKKDMTKASEKKPEAVPEKKTEAVETVAAKKTEAVVENNIEAVPEKKIVAEAGSASSSSASSSGQTLKAATTNEVTSLAKGDTEASAEKTAS